MFSVMERAELRMPLEIRRCREADLRELEWFGALRAHRELIRGAYERQLLGSNWMLVADVRGFPVGQLWVDLAQKPGVGVLWAFRVMPPFKGMGIGSRLLRAADWLLRAHGFAQAEVGVEHGNPGALRLYLRHGFEIVGEEEDRYEVQDESGAGVEHVMSVQVLRKRLETATEAEAAR